MTDINIPERFGRIKRCPFCRGDADIIHLYDENSQITGAKIVCTFCEATFTHPLASSDDDLIEAWNRRD